MSTTLRLDTLTDAEFAEHMAGRLPVVAKDVRSLAERVPGGDSDVSPRVLTALFAYVRELDRRSSVWRMRQELNDHSPDCPVVALSVWQKAHRLPSSTSRWLAENGHITAWKVGRDWVVLVGQVVPPEAAVRRRKGS